ncbi:hypothetical protein SB861_37655 [Paraburkholderia sp. SIMBA_049]
MKKSLLVAVLFASAVAAAVSTPAFADQAGPVNEGKYEQVQYKFGASDDKDPFKSGNFSDGRLPDGTIVIRGGQ